jgi:hypothetical protein
MTHMDTPTMPESSSEEPPTASAWTELVLLQTVDQAGGMREVSVRIGHPASARILLTDGDSPTDISGPDYRDCLTQARRLLEAEGRLLCCQGARPDANASGMLSQFSNGREAYLLQEPKDENGHHRVVDIFAPAPAPAVTTLDDQRRRVLRQLGLDPGRYGG